MMSKSRLDLAVLYVDDDLQACMVMEGLLRIYVREVFVAHDGTDGLDVFRRKRPDVIVTDFTMPTMDGGEMVRAIRAFAPEAAVVFISAHDDAWLAEQLSDVGITRHVTKPVDVAKLLDILKELATA